MRHRYLASTTVGIVLGGLVASIVLFNSYPTDNLQIASYQTSVTHAAGLATEFGVNGAVASASGDSGKQTAVNLITGAGFGWNRQEYTYAATIDFTPYDTAISKTRAAGIKTLGLLTYPGTSVSHDGWKSYVSAVVGRYSDVSAWEIMNEADTYLSAADYTTYLSEARTIIRGISSSATIVASGLTSRIEATSFWDGIAAAGGWGLFDVIGLHVYHSGNPESVNFGGGDLVGELGRVVGDINKNGGGKTIWITEMGYQSSVVGDAGQSNYLSRAFIMSRSVSSVAKIFIYRLYDDGPTYGLVTSSFSPKTSYNQIKSTIASLSGLGTGTKLTPQTKTTLDAMDSTSGWKTDATSNGTTSLSTVGGHTGNGMKIAYSFTADSAYAVAQKSIKISGNPTALGVWINGDDTRNVWKFRFTDNNNETFQADLGSIPSGWQYKQFTFGVDTAVTSWGGNGVIDFPISFNSVVLDRQGGSASGSGIVDDLIAISGSADLNAYQFGGTVAWWKASGSDTAALCGASRSFTETPQFASGVSCSDTPVAASSSSSSSTTTKKTVTPAAPKVPVDKTKSYIRVDGANVPADGTSTFQIVVGVKDASGNFLTDRTPGIIIGGGQATLGAVTLIGPEWITKISSTQASVHTAQISAGGVDLGTLSMTFVAPIIPLALTTSSTTGTVAAAAPTSTPPWKNPAYLLGGVSLLIFLIGASAEIRQLWLHRHFVWLFGKSKLDLG